MIDVCLLGHGGMMPLPQRPLSATVLRVGGEVILFDCGEGTQVAWRRCNFNFRTLGTMLLSHHHADHLAGLPGMLFQIAFSGREEPLRIFGPHAIEQAVHGLMTIVGTLPYEIELVLLDGGEHLEVAAGIQLSTTLLRHRAPCIGYSLYLPRQPRFNPERAAELSVPVELWSRLQSGEAVGGVRPEDVTEGPREGLRVSLVTDSAYFPDLALFVAQSDLLVCESTFVDDEDAGRAWERGHMTLRQATQLASEAGVRELWLTHFSPKVMQPQEHEAQAREWFARTRIGYPGLSTTLAFRDEERDADEGS